MDLDLRWLRRQFIAALASDEDLFGLLILKGGNALDLLHGLGGRASLDLDYSLEGDLDRPDEIREKLLQALRGRLAVHGLTLFDGAFSTKPRTGGEGKWGGYVAEFKVIPTPRLDFLLGDFEKARRESLTISGDPQGRRVFRIEISKHEYCGDFEEIEVADGVKCRVYSLGMIAAEKLRSLCQQMEEYPRRTTRTRRSRDFYDLYGLLTEGQVDLSTWDFQDSIRATFQAKEVPLRLLSLLPETIAFHEEDWDAARDEIPAHRSQDFQFYTSFVLDEVTKLQPLWEEEPPV